jgi:hypothetical protein
MGEGGEWKRLSGTTKKRVKNDIYEYVQCEKRNAMRYVSNKDVMKGLGPQEKMG